MAFVVTLKVSDLEKYGFLQSPAHCTETAESDFVSKMPYTNKHNLMTFVASLL